MTVRPGRGETPSTPAERLARWPWAAAGLACAALAVGVAEVVAGVLQPSSAPLVASGDAVVDLTPGWLKTWAIETFGTRDKQVLLATAALVVAALAVAAGVLARRRPVQAQWLVLALGAVGALAAATRPDAGNLSVLPSLVGAVAGAFVLAAVRRRTAPPASTSGSAPAGAAASGSAVVQAAPGRRSVLLASAAVAAGGAVAAGLGRVAAAALHAADASRAAVRLPAPARPAPALPGAVDVGVPGVVPFRVPNADFYRIDTALVVPSVRAGDWRLRIHGMVGQEVELDFATLLAQPLVERDITLCCVSNEVGGDLIGNARWLGLPIGPLLARAGPAPDADMVLSTSADGWTASTPLAALTDGRDALLAVGMNGEPLPVEHGFPVRMVVPGLYGYVSATKWVVDLEVTRFDRAQAYWTPRGWSARGPVKTQSRIDVPAADARLRPGRVAVAGVAWAQHRGIEGVQVRVDGGAWADARLGAEASVDTWRQWSYAWDATPGRHTLQVRGTDGTGEVQTERQAPPAPDGATGWQTIEVTVT